MWGSIVGAVGATVFVWANRGALSAPWSGLAVAAWAVGLAAYVVTVFVLPRRFPAPPPVRRSAGLVYLASVGGMLVLINLGRLVLERSAHEDLQPALIVLAVGAHFLPFAAAFHTPMFRRLGAVMVALGVLGLLLGLWWTSTAAPSVAVVAGLVMLALISSDALHGHEPNLRSRSA